MPEKPAPLATGIVEGSKCAATRKIIRASTVEEMTGRSRTSIWRDVRSGRFPAPVKIGPGAIGWFADEIEAHQASLERVLYAHATVENDSQALKAAAPAAQALTGRRSNRRSGSRP